MSWLKQKPRLRLNQIGEQDVLGLPIGLAQGRRVLPVVVRVGDLLAGPREDPEQSRVVRGHPRRVGVDQRAVQRLGPLPLGEVRVAQTAHGLEVVGLVVPVDLDLHDLPEGGRQPPGVEGVEDGVLTREGLAVPHRDVDLARCGRHRAEVDELVRLARSEADL